MCVLNEGVRTEHLQFTQTRKILSQSLFMMIVVILVKKNKSSTLEYA